MKPLEIFKVICINKVYDENHRPLDHLYIINKTYNAAYYFEYCAVGDNNIIEYEWVVHCSEHNHYQFTDKDFKKYFIGVSEKRDSKINAILES